MRRHYLWVGPIGMMIAGCVMLHPSSAAPASSSPVDPPLAAPTVVVSGTATSPTPSPTQSIKVVPQSVPVRLEIPRLGVNAPLDPISPAADNSLTPPDDARHVGWWKEGMRLGSPTGTVILTGHTVHTGGGALNYSYMLRSGDIIVAVGANGLSYRYRVVSNITYLETAIPADKVGRQYGLPQISIVTCDIQSYNKATHVYERNTVVIAVPVT